MLFGCVYLRTSLGKSWIIFAGRTTQFPSINSQFFLVQTDFFWKKILIFSGFLFHHGHLLTFFGLTPQQRFPKNPPSKPQRVDPGSTDPSYPRQCDWTHLQETWRLTHQQKIWSNINRWSFLFVSGKIVVFECCKNIGKFKLAMTAIIILHDSHGIIIRLFSHRINAGSQEDLGFTWLSSALKKYYLNMSDPGRLNHEDMLD